MALRWLLPVGLLIALALLALSVVGDELDLRLEGDASQVGLPGTPVHFDFTVRYDGAQTSGAVVFFHLRDEPGGWSHILYGLSNKSEQESPLELWLVIFPGETAVVNLTVTPGDSPLAGQHWMSVHSEVEGEEHLNDSVGISVVIDKRLDFELGIVDKPQDRYYALPSRSARVLVDIDNTGNHGDTYAIEATILSPAPGWNVDRVEGLGPLGDTPAVPAYSSHRLVVVVSVPDDAPHLEWRELRVTATSLGEPFGKRRSDTVKVVVDLASHLAMEVVGGSKLEADPNNGTEHSWDVKVANLGNGADIVEGAVSFPGWSGGLVVDIVPEVQNISSGETVLYRLNVTIPPGVMKGIYVFTIHFNSTLSNLSVEQLVELKVMQSFGIELWAEEPRIRTPPGGNIEFRVHVRNAGNGLDTIEVDLIGLPPKWLHYITPPEVTLLQDQDANVTIIVIVPSRFLEGPSEVCRLSFRADSARSEALEYLDLFVEIERFFRVEWYDQLHGPLTDTTVTEARPNAVLPGGIRINPFVQEGLKVQLLMRNYGSSEANVTVSCLCTDSNVTVTAFPEVVRLLHRGEAYTVVTLGFPRAIPSGMYAIYFSLDVVEDPSLATRVAPVSLEFFHYDVAVDDASVTGTALERDEGGNLSTRLGDPVTLRFSVVDLGSAEARDVTVRLYHTAPNGTRMLLDENVLEDIDGSVGLTYRWEARDVGLHEFEVVLGLAEQSDTANDVWTVTVEAVRPPPGDGGASMGGAEVGGILLLLVGVVLLALAVRSVKVRPGEDE